MFLVFDRRNMEKILVIGLMCALSVSSITNYNLYFFYYYVFHTLNVYVKGRDSEFILKNIKLQKIKFQNITFKRIQ